MARIRVLLVQGTTIVGGIYGECKQCDSTHAHIGHDSDGQPIYSVLGDIETAEASAKAESVLKGN